MIDEYYEMVKKAVNTQRIDFIEKVMKNPNLQYHDRIVHKLSHR
jgi:hypothetical protein